MLIKELIRRGTNHKNFCEDAVYSKQSDDIVYLGVFDGCSTGDKSHFASELMSKLFKRAVNYFEFKHKIDTDKTAEEIMKLVFVDFFTFLQISKVVLDVSVDEILSTLVLAIVKKNVTSKISPEGTTYSEVKTVNYDVCVVMSGDGAYFIDNKLKIVDSIDNKPDYISYHLLEGVADAWKSLKVFNHVVDDISNFAIMSDGIVSFKKINSENVNNYLSNDEEKFLIDKLLVDSKLSKSDAMLPRKMNILENQGYNHFDDLSIIRILNDE